MPFSVRVKLQSLEVDVDPNTLETTWTGSFPVVSDGHEVIVETAEQAEELLYLYKNVNGSPSDSDRAKFVAAATKK